MRWAWTILLVFGLFVVATADWTREPPQTPRDFRDVNQINLHTYEGMRTIWDTLSLISDSAGRAMDTASLGLFNANMAMDTASLGLFNANMAMDTASLGLFNANMTADTASLGLFNANMAMDTASLGLFNANMAMDTASLGLFNANTNHDTLDATNLDRVTDIGNYTTNDVKVGNLYARDHVLINYDSTNANVFVYFGNNDGAYDYIQHAPAASKFVLSQSVQIIGDLEVDGNDIDIGDAGGYSGIKFDPATTRIIFYIDGDTVGAIGTDGAYVDLVP